ncbi:hypothetical protein BJY00DRAFT_315227 [Aspergillus carlsbadensis]|nr:hypothetical protein BJY00DRAFT_315227 [Aspergillus carlsbadensis]
MDSPPMATQEQGGLSPEPFVQQNQGSDYKGAPILMRSWFGSSKSIRIALIKIGALSTAPAMLGNAADLSKTPDGFWEDDDNGDHIRPNDIIEGVPTAVLNLVNAATRM